MKDGTKFRLLISYLVASQCLIQQPVFAADPLSNLNGYLAAIAAHNGAMYMNAAAPSRSTAPTTMPTKAEVVSMVRQLPKGISYPNGLPTPDPTDEEALTLIPPVTDVAQVMINGQLVDPVFGTITSVDQTLTGQFDDLSTTDMSQFEPTTDPNWFDPNTDANGNDLQLSPTAYDIVDPVLNDEQRAMSRRTIALTAPIGLLEKKIAVAVSGGELALVDAPAGANAGATQKMSSSLALLALPEVPFATADEPVLMPSETVIAHDTKGSIMLQGHVETSVDGSSFMRTRERLREVELACGARLNARKGAMLWIEEDSADHLKVKVATDGVSINVNGTRVDMQPGEELAWTRDSRDAVALLKDGIARRNVTHHALPDGSKIVVSEFSLLHLLSKQSDATVTPFRGEILKTVAALGVACRHHGRYQVIANGN